jgi:hypothetical protein
MSLYTNNFARHSPTINRDGHNRVPLPLMVSAALVKHPPQKIIDERSPPPKIID